MSQDAAAERLNALLLQHSMEPLDEPTATRFSVYFDLLTKWNRRLNLTSIRTQGGILQRHFLESIFCARHLPADVSTLLDYGSGAGFPGIPIACCRDDIAVTLAESHARKGIFLQGVVRCLSLRATVYNGRAETLPRSSFGAVTLRAVDSMDRAVRAAEGLVAPGGWLALLIGTADVETYAGTLSGYQLHLPLRIPGTDQGVLLLAQRHPQSGWTILAP